MALPHLLDMIVQPAVLDKELFSVYPIGLRDFCRKIS
jgi:hypothetical protein